MESNRPFAKPAIFEIFDQGHPGGAETVADALGVEVESRFGPRDETPLSILAKGEDGALLGGLMGASHWRWLYVQRLWVAKPWRGLGLGRRLLKEAEAQAQLRGCVGLYLDTFDEAAATFYERNGFERCGRIDEFPPGASRIYLMKRLTS